MAKDLDEKVCRRAWWLNDKLFFDRPIDEEAAKELRSLRKSLRPSL